MDKKSKKSVGTTQPALLDRVARKKTGIVNRSRKGILIFYKNIGRVPVLGAVFSKAARKVVGGSLHTVKIEVNSHCNQKCRTCYVSDREMDLSREVIHSIAKEIRGYKINLDIIGGEPLLRTDLEEIVSDVKQEGKSPRVSVYTNGLLATNERCLSLKQAGLDVAIVTLHSHLPEVHDSISQNPGSWEKGIAGIRAFQDAGVKVYVATVVHRENIGTIKETLDFIEKDLSASAVFTKYIPDSADSPFTLTTKEWREFRRWLIYDKKVDHMKEVESFFSLTGSCPSGNYMVAVKSDGTVQPCPFAVGFALGKMPESSLWDIYENRFNLETFQTLKKIPNQCEKCVLNHLCGGGCRSASYGVFDGLCGKDPLCGGPYTEWPKDEPVMDALPIHF